jgi:hypothetical protein
LDKAPDDPTAVAWRLEVEDFEADEPETWAALEVLLARAGDGGPAVLVIGEWGTRRALSEAAICGDRRRRIRAGRNCR